MALKWREMTVGCQQCYKLHERLPSTADDSQSSVLYVENVHAMADALDLVDYLESRGPGNKLLACKLWEKSLRRSFWAAHVNISESAGPKTCLSGTTGVPAHR